ncbi:regulatory protein, LysR [Klebsiella pneumoniae]|uniref:Regulatory protein, LysR n=1 Tax=Klebsiella pneumoniae TaxID=573 RepID=A0A378F5V5_KLEPN|nr:regulatory protein, LysR [Klebsiella pneumoniae]
MPIWPWRPPVRGLRKMEAEIGVPLLHRHARG